MRCASRLTTTVFLALLAAASGTITKSAGPDATAQTASAATARIVAAAQALTSTLDDAERSKVQFPFDGPQRARWSNFPSGIFQREGLRMGDLTAPQREAVMNLLAAALSADGFRKVTNIVRGDEVLRKTDGGRGARGGGRGGGRPGGPPGGGVNFGEDQYYLAFVGTPSTTTPWMLQFGGHHLAINLTMAGSQASMTPSLPAAQPATYTFEGRTDSPARPRERQGVRADQRARRHAAQPGDPHLPRRRSRARSRAGRPDDPARRHARVGADRRRSRRCCSISCTSGPAS